MTSAIRLTINGTEHEIACEARKTLVDAIREDCGLTGTHAGCEHGVCGTCTVLLDGQPIRSCLTFAVQANGRQITTVEGLGREDEMHPLQQAFADHFALQCGFCTPGFLMLGKALLDAEGSPDDETIRAALSSNLCRCTGYAGIVAAVKSCIATKAKGA